MLAGVIRISTFSPPPRHLSLCARFSDYSLKYPLTLKTLRSKFEFSFVAPIHFLQKWWGEVDEISSKFIMCDHVCNSHDHSVLQNIAITRRNLTLISLIAQRVKITDHVRHIGVLKQ